MVSGNGATGVGPRLMGFLTTGFCLLTPIVVWAGSRESTPSAPSVRAPVADLLADPGALIAWLLAHNQEVAAAQARVDQAAADVGRSALYPNPTLDFTLSNLGVGTTTPPGLGFNQMAIYTTQVSETIELGKRGPRIEAAQRRLDSQREAFLDDLAAHAAAARAALGRVVHLWNRLMVLEEVLRGAHEVLDLERERLNHGDISGMDFNRLWVDTMSLESEVSQGRAEYEAALADCRALLFAPCSVEGVDSALLDQAAQMPPTPDLDGILQMRPDVRALRLAAESLAQEAILAKRRAIPDPTFGLGYTHDRFTISGDIANSLMVSVSLPLPVFDRGQHDAALARARQAELQSTLAATLERAKADVDGLAKRLETLAKTLADLQGSAIPKSAEVLEGTMEAFGRGQVSMTDLLLARRTHTSLLLKAMDLRFELFLVRNDLRRVLGLDAALARAEEHKAP